MEYRYQTGLGACSETAQYRKCLVCHVQLSALHKLLLIQCDRDNRLDRPYAVTEPDSQYRKLWSGHIISPMLWIQGILIKCHKDTRLNGHVQSERERERDIRSV